MANKAVLTSSGAIKVFGPLDTTSQIYPKTSITGLLEVFSGKPARFALIAYVGGRTIEIISLSEDPSDPGFGNEIFGATTPMAAESATAAILGSSGSSGSSGASPTDTLLTGIQSTATEQLISAQGQLASCQAIEASTSAIDQSVRDGIEGSPQILSISNAIEALQGVAIPGEPIASGTPSPNSVAGSGMLGWLSTLVNILRLVPQTVNELLTVQTLSATRTHRRFTEKYWSSATAINAAAVVVIPAQGTNKMVIIDQIIASYGATPTGGFISISGIQTAPGAPSMDSAHTIAITSPGPAPLIDVLMRGAANQSVSIALAAGGSAVSGALWIGWHSEQT